MQLVVILPLIIALFWIAGFLFAADFSVPTKSINRFKKVLVIFPHADDEAITCGGSLHHLAEAGCTVTLTLLTKGERGTPDATTEVSLKEMRTREARVAAKQLGISSLRQEDFGDGELNAKKQVFMTFIEHMIKQEKPDLMITYDLAGFYGHADHIACSEIITELRKNTFPAVPLWYVTFPERILAIVKPPEHLVGDSYFKERQALPTHKVFVGTSILPKIKACYAYRSQRNGFMNGAAKYIPLWFFLSMSLFEYFAEAD